MRELSILEEQLLDEYFRCERNLKAQMAYLEENAVHGYISHKKIKERDYYYLQRRDGKHIVSKYIPKNVVPLLSQKIEERKKWQKSIKNLKRDMQSIERILGKECIDERRN